MLFLHETHRVIGRWARDFEDLVRDEWMGALARTDDTRLVWYLNHAMGSGPAYEVVTITALADGAAWESLGQRMREGDLTDLATRLDSYRHAVEGKLLVPVYWSALQGVDLATVPTDADTHDLSLYMQDTGWPDATARRVHRAVGPRLLADHAGDPRPRGSCSTSRPASRWPTDPASGPRPS